MANTTIKEALAGKIGYPLSDSSLNTALTDAGIDGDSVYTSSYTKDVDLLAAKLLLYVCTTPNISEGGYSISISDKQALLKVRSLILAEWGVVDISIPSISDGTGLW